MMMNRFDTRGEKNRRMLGLAIPFLGGLLPWVLWPSEMSWVILDQGDLFGSDFWLSLHWIFLRIFIGEMIVLAGFGAALLKRSHALVLVPLAVLVGCLVGLNFFPVEPLSYLYHHDPIRHLLYLLPVLVEAEIGAIIGLGVVKGIPLVQRALVAVQQQVKAELRASPTQIFPPSAPASSLNPRVSQTEQPTTRDGGATTESPEPAVPEQDDIARVLAQMQREYAEAAKLGHKGPHPQ